MRSGSDDSGRVVGKPEVIVGRVLPGFFLRSVSAKLRRDENTTELMLQALSGDSLYCFSNTNVLVYFFPFESVPVRVTVRLLPSADTTARPVIVTVSPFLLVEASV